MRRDQKKGPVITNDAKPFVKEWEQRLGRRRVGLDEMGCLLEDRYSYVVSQHVNAYYVQFIMVSS